MDFNKNTEVKILLDLNYTLVGNSQENKYTRPYQRKNRKEIYREWLLDLVRDYYVILITARPEYQKDVTLENIKYKLHWQPDESYWNELKQRPPECKERILHEYVFPKHGNNGPEYLAIESNPNTKRMYKKYEIPSVSAYTKEDKPIITKAIHEDNFRNNLLNKPFQKPPRKRMNISQKTLNEYKE